MYLYANPHKSAISYLFLDMFATACPRLNFARSAAELQPAPAALKTPGFAPTRNCAGRFAPTQIFAG
jgi:hypothetical protein